MKKGIIERQKFYITYKEGAELYRMSLNSFKKYAKEAHATVPLGDGSLTLVDTRIFEQYLEMMRA